MGPSSDDVHTYRYFSSPRGDVSRNGGRRRSRVRALVRTRPQRWGTIHPLQHYPDQEHCPKGGTTLSSRENYGLLFPLAFSITSMT
jgi:hypothetical protein